MLASEPGKRAAPRSVGAPAKSKRRWRRHALAVAALVCLLLVGLAVGRSLIAERLATAWLAGQHVPAGVTVQQLSLSGLSAKVRLGPPADPDLTVERMDVNYVLVWTKSGLGVQTRSVRLLQPHIKARFADGGLSFGDLDTLIRVLTRRPPGAPPTAPPDVIVKDGELLLAASGGTLTARGDATIIGGLPWSADVTVAPFALSAGGERISGSGLRLRLARVGDRLAARIETGSAAVGPGKLEGATLIADLPPPTANGRFSGPARLTLDATGLRGGDAARTALKATFDGTIAVDPQRQSLTGRLAADAQAGSLAAAGLAVRRPSLRVDLSALSLVNDASGLVAQASGSALAVGAEAHAGDVALRQVTLPVRIQGARVALRPSGADFAATLSGSLTAQGAMDAPSAERLASKIPIVASEPAYKAATARALTAFRFVAPGWSAQVSPGSVRLTVSRPASLQGAGGAQVSLLAGAASFGPHGAVGSASLALGGGGLPSLAARFAPWSADAGGFQSTVAAAGGLDFLFARGAKGSLNGHASFAGGRFRFDLASCTPLSADKLAFDPNPITHFAGRICPAAAPLVEAGRDGWRAAGRIGAARADAPSFAAVAADAAGAYAAAGAGRGLQSLTLTLDRGRISDATDPIRFHGVDARGRLILAAGAWQGDFVATTPTGHPLATLHLVDDVATGAGRADIAAKLDFVPGGVQPAEISPLANFARSSAGPARFTGWFAWSRNGPATSGGEFIAPDFRFTSPLGAVLGADIDVKFVSLNPLQTAPNQTITVRGVQWIVPIKGLSATFDLDARALNLKAFRADIAGGQASLEPMAAPLASGSTLRGAIVFNNVNLGDVVAASNLSNVMKLDAVVNGRIPFEYGPHGLRIENGAMAAVRPGRISVSRNAIGGQGQQDLARDLAYQAMEDLAFDKLDASLNSTPGDRLGILFHINGSHDPAKAQQARLPVSALMSGRAFQQPIPLPSGTKINLTLDTSLNFGELVRSLGEAWREALSGDQAEPSAAVQGPAAQVPSK